MGNYTPATDLQIKVRETNVISIKFRQVLLLLSFLIIFATSQSQSYSSVLMGPGGSKRNLTNLTYFKGGITGSLSRNGSQSDTLTTRPFSVNKLIALL